jgi:hypothetical protein
MIGYKSTHNSRGSSAFCGSTPRLYSGLYSEDLTQLELELSHVPELAVATEN